ncbi:PucR family transcriptional regulator [Nocardioides bizhenqiangii]|uniref:Helix-turn-helix domain-containing protein n=1 Tax=Nocardioides bizhenqiangii TaxID=3095076 RepID=A0ABZ0ZQB0_9ACTN|nr:MULTISPECIES: helix-turn-helix domain-containing protein [unclassified Nocardioides]MDZ5619858.1 helix-turn-helix domain-containing protein [Nocardioides sp. HM23]WQQ26136.1 helix-turn-helix domain-containing protein [Nocardioides sp. HM61]
MGELVFAPEVRSLGRRLMAYADPLGVRAAERIRAEIPGYDEAQGLIFDELAASCSRNLRYVLGILAHGPVPGLEVPPVTGATLAEQGVPYESVLQATRIGGRFIWELLVEQSVQDEHEVLLSAAADIWSVIDDLSDQVTEAYRRALTERSRRDTVRAVLVGGLLDGDEPADQIAEAARILGFEGARDFVVVSAESPGPGVEGLPDVEAALLRSDVASAWHFDNHHQEGVVALRVGFGIFDLAAVLQDLTVARVGISRPFGALDRAVDGRFQARAVCAAASPGSTEVVRYDERPLGVLLADGPEHARDMVDTVLGEVFDLRSEDAAALLETARTWLATGGSYAATAKSLDLHKNTVRFRMDRFQDITKCDLTRPADAAEAVVALECARILGLG